MPRRDSCLLYDPYLGTLGGGERYLLAMAACLGDDLAVTVAAPQLPSIDALRTAGFPSDIRMMTFPERLVTLRSARYDVLIYLSNDPPYPSLARRSFLVAQFPFVGTGSTPLRRAASRVGLARYRCIVYSEFVRHWLRVRWNREAVVITPPVELGTYVESAKRKDILAVGRFFPDQHSKRQDVLVTAFRRLPEVMRREWRLVLVGGIDPRPESLAYLERIRALAQGENIVVETTVSAERLRGLYRRAALFWHATGFGRPDSQPERAEHFGIAPVEAMSWGAVPLVYDDGGQRETVTGEVGVRWSTVEDLVRHTVDLAGNAARRSSMAAAAEAAARAYGYDRFCRKVRATVVEGRVRHG